METTGAGGINKTVREIAKNLSKMEKHEVLVLQANPLHLSETEDYEGFKIVRMDLKYSDYLYGIDIDIYRHLKKYLAEFKPDIVHVHGYHTLFSMEIIYMIKKIIKFETLIVFSPHYGTDSHDTLAGKYLWGIYNLLGNEILRLVDKIICASNYEYKNVINTFSAAFNKCIIIPHGVDEILLTNNQEKKSSESLVTASYLLELKGIQHILYALAELRFNRGINAKLTIIGEGNYKIKLMELAQNLHLEDSIEWSPFLKTNELNHRLRLADIFLLLSRSENYGIIVAEALALGTPCIVANTTALSEFVSEPGCFGVASPPDPKEVADLIIKIFQNNIKVGPFSKKIRVWGEIAKDYEMLYSGL